MAYNFVSNDLLHLMFYKMNLGLPSNSCSLLTSLLQNHVLGDILYFFSLSLTFWIEIQSFFFVQKPVISEQKTVILKS